MALYTWFITTTTQMLYARVMRYLANYQTRLNNSINIFIFLKLTLLFNIMF